MCTRFKRMSYSVGKKNDRSLIGIQLIKMIKNGFFKRWIKRIRIHIELHRISNLNFYAVRRVESPFVCRLTFGVVVSPLCTASPFSRWVCSVSISSFLSYFNFFFFLLTFLQVCHFEWIAKKTGLHNFNTVLEMVTREYWNISNEKFRNSKRNKICFHTAIIITILIKQQQQQQQHLQMNLTV